MSNYLAIATTTAALSNLLSNGITPVAPLAQVEIGRPDNAESPPDYPRVNLYLYQVEPNQALRNVDLPTRTSDGAVIRRPQVALDLYYLLSFYTTGGSMTTPRRLDPERLLGHVVRVLHDHPVLTAQDINEVAVAGWELDNSDLVRQVEKVRFTPVPLNLEELSKLWSSFFQTPYALSVVYRASVVLIEAERVPTTALPVAERKLYTMPFRHPVIDSITPTEGAEVPITHSSTILIKGRQLRGDITFVCIGDTETEPAQEDLRDSQIELAVPSGLFAGVNGARVAHKIAMGDPEVAHNGFESNVAPFVLIPTVEESTEEPPSGKIKLDFYPDVGIRQRVLLLLNQKNFLEGTEGYSYVIEAPPGNGIVPPADKIGTIDFDISGVTAAQYYFRVSVDGAISVLSEDNVVTIS